MRDENVGALSADRGAVQKPQTAAQALVWALINLGQAIFLGVWSSLCVTLALVALCVTFRRTIPLALARRMWAPVLLWAARARMTTRGFEGLDRDAPYVFAFNHESLIDTAVAFYAVPVNIRFVLKREVMFIPFIGAYAWAMGMSFVDRKNHERAMRSMKDAAEHLAAGASIMVFPEGRRARTPELQPFKKGAFVLAIQAGVPVVPVAIVGSRDVLPPDTFRVRPGEIRVQAGAPIPTADLTLDDRDALRDRVFDEIARLKRQAAGEA